MQEYMYLVFVGILAIIVLVFPVCFLIHKERKSLAVDRVSRVVNYTTILTSITSAAVGVVTVFVMIGQCDTQKRLLEVQEAEHQPTFIIKRSLYRSDSSNVNDYEEYSIENIGERVKNITKIDQKTFIEVSYSDNTKKIISYIPLQYYYQASFTTGDVQGVIQCSGYSNYNKNHLKFSNLYQQALAYSGNKFNAYVFVAAIRFFIISYEDIYSKEHVVYMKDNNLVSQEYFEGIEKLSISDYGYKSYDLSELDMNIFWNDCAQIREYKNAL